MEAMTEEPMFAGGRWTLDVYRNFVVSALRKASMKYPVKSDVKLAARRTNHSANKRLLWEYQCNQCLGWFTGKETQVDHIEELGDILADPGGYIGRLFCEADGMQCLCKGCHQAATRARKERGE